MQVLQVANAFRNESVKIDGPGLAGLVIKADGNLDETSGHLSSLSKDSLILSVEDPRVLGATQDFGKNGDAAKAAALLGKGWQPKTITAERGIFELQGQDAAQYAVLDRKGNGPTRSTMINEYSFSDGKIQHFAAAEYMIGFDKLMPTMEAIKVKTDKDLHYNVNNLA